MPKFEPLITLPGTAEHYGVEGVECFQAEGEGGLVTDRKSSKHGTIEISKPV